MSVDRQEAWRAWGPPGPGMDMWEWQAGRCAWCGCDKFSLVRDHCHDTGLIRGLLCSGCNVHESTQWHAGVWDAWRSGENPAMVTKTFEVYVSTTGATPITHSSPLAYYTPGERKDWWARTLASLGAGGDWPTSAPWTEAATSRKAVAYAKLHRVLNDPLASFFATDEVA